MPNNFYNHINSKWACIVGVKIPSNNLKNAVTITYNNGKQDKNKIKDNNHLSTITYHKDKLSELLYRNLFKVIFT